MKDQCIECGRFIGSNEAHCKSCAWFNQHQGDLFGKTPEQCRDEAMQRVEDHANRAEPQWSATAAQYLQMFLRNCADGAAFTTEDVRIWSHSHGCPMPPDSRAWGPIVRKAAIDGTIVETGSTVAKTAHCHRGFIRKWTHAK